MLGDIRRCSIAALTQEPPVENVMICWHDPNLVRRSTGFNERSHAGLSGRASAAVPMWLPLTPTLSPHAGRGLLGGILLSGQRARIGAYVFPLPVLTGRGLG